jgi:Zn-dependent protease with chaperone function
MGRRQIWRPGTVTIAAERICAVVDRRRRLGGVAGSGAALFAARQLLQASCSRDAERNADAFAVVTMQRLGRSSSAGLASCSCA